MKTTNGFKISRLETEMREREKLMKELLPLRTLGDKRLFTETQEEVKKLSNQISRLRKADIPKRDFASRLK